MLTEVVVFGDVSCFPLSLHFFILSYSVTTRLTVCVRMCVHMFVCCFSGGFIRYGSVGASDGDLLKILTEVSASEEGRGEICL